MASRLSRVRRLAIDILLIQSLAQALQPYRVPAQIIAKLDDAPQNGTAVPGDSPVRYHDDPSSDLFIIESLDMHPNPCVLESYCGVIIHGTFTESLVNTTPQLSFNVTSHFPQGREGLVAGEDDLCNWVDIIQDDSDSDSSNTTTSSFMAAPYDTNYLAPDPENPLLYRFKHNLEKRKDMRFCPPKKGKAKITSTILLLGGYVPEANYTAKVRATEKGKRGGDGHGGGRGGEGRTLWDLWTEFELKYKEGIILYTKCKILESMTYDSIQGQCFQGSSQAGARSSHSSIAKGPASIVLTGTVFILLPLSICLPLPSFSPCISSSDIKDAFSLGSLTIHAPP